MLIYYIEVKFKRSLADKIKISFETIFVLTRIHDIHFWPRRKLMMFFPR